MTTRTMNCRICGQFCTTLDEDDFEMLKEGASDFYSIHISCERERKRKEAEDAHLSPVEFVEGLARGAGLDIDELDRADRVSRKP